MQQPFLWSEEIEQGVNKPLCAFPATAVQSPYVQPHHHIKLWFYDARREEVIMCTEERDFRTRYGPDEVWSTQFVGGALTTLECCICNPQVAFSAGSSTACVDCGTVEGVEYCPVFVVRLCYSCNRFRMQDMQHGLNGSLAKVAY